MCLKAKNHSVNDDELEIISFPTYLYTINPENCNNHRLDFAVFGIIYLRLNDFLVKEMLYY